MLTKNSVKIEYHAEKYGGGKIEVVESEYYRGFLGGQKEKTTVLYECQVRIGDDAIAIFDAIKDKFTATHGANGYVIFDGFGVCVERFESIRKSLTEINDHE